MEEMFERGYLQWTGKSRPKTKNVSALLALGYLKWTRAGREARERRFRDLQSRYGARMLAEQAAAEEQTLP